MDARVLVLCGNMTTASPVLIAVGKTWQYIRPAITMAPAQKCFDGIVFVYSETETGFSGYIPLIKYVISNSVTSTTLHLHLYLFTARECGVVMCSVASLCLSVCLSLLFGL